MIDKPLDIGIASWQSPDKLDRTIQAIRNLTVGEWRLLVVDNNSPDPRVKEVIDKHATADSRVVPVYLESNGGYATAVNKILELAETQYVAYFDNDAYVQTHGWNQSMMNILEVNHEVAMVFPNGGSHPMQRSGYTEILWGVGFSWILKKARYEEVGGFDAEIGHQQECDYSLRLRLAGWKLAADTGVHVRHDATATRDPAAQERINQGVIDFVNKWCKYFCGPNVNYYSDNVIRWEDWHPNALYLEEYYRQFVPNLNADAETITINGQELDLCRVPRWKWLYRNRII